MMPSQSSQIQERVWVMLPLLPDELLLDAYRNALRLQLEREFLHMLKSEIRRRKLFVPEERFI